MEWVDEFRQRMRGFEHLHPEQEGGVPVSIKVRVTGGCFHREHSPHAYQLIDKFLHAHHLRDEGISFEEHESGPEVLAYIVLTAGVLNLSVSVINLITAIIKARSEGIKHGDHPNAPVELIVRRFNNDGKLQEEKVLTFHTHDKVDAKLIETALQNSLGAGKPEAPKRKRRMK